MEVEIVDGAIVDLAPENGVRLVRQALRDAVDGCKRVVKLRAGRSARPEVDLEGLLLHALGQSKRNGLGYEEAVKPLMPMLMPGLM